MGSGISNSYSGTKGASQPYTPTYSVVDNQLKNDKLDSDIYNSETGYFKNPTAIALEESVVNNSIYVDGNKQNGTITYVVDENGTMIIAVRNNPNDGRKRSPHPTLIGGKDPKVQCAGMITFRKGKIESINNNSGHFKPNIKSIEVVNSYLDDLFSRKPELFSRYSKWRNKK